LSPHTAYHRLDEEKLPAETLFTGAIYSVAANPNGYAEMGISANDYP
jgi:hypothetical protein